MLLGYLWDIGLALFCFLKKKIPKKLSGLEKLVYQNFSFCRC